MVVGCEGRTSCWGGSPRMGESFALDATRIAGSGPCLTQELIRDLAYIMYPAPIPRFLRTRAFRSICRHPSMNQFGMILVTPLKDIQAGLSRNYQKNIEENLHLIHMPLCPLSLLHNHHRKAYYAKRLKFTIWESFYL